MLATHYDDELPITLDIRGPGQLCGWISFLRGKPSDWLSAIDQTKIFVIRPERFIELLKNNVEFGNYFDKMPSLHESYDVIKSYLSSLSRIPSSIDHNYILALASKSNGMGIRKENYLSIYW